MCASAGMFPTRMINRCHVLSVLELEVQLSAVLAHTLPELEELSLTGMRQID